MKKMSEVKSSELEDTALNSFGHILQCIDDLTARVQYPDSSDPLTQPGIHSRSILPNCSIVILSSAAVYVSHFQSKLYSLSFFVE